MKKGGIIFIIAFFSFIQFYISCKKKDKLYLNTTPFSLKIPAGFPQPQNIFANNPLTEESFVLGKKLFYDDRLASESGFSCASCHQQFAAFATFDHDLSHGVNGAFTTRNAPGLFNLAWKKELHWDGGINHIEVQPLAPIEAANEMGETIGNVINKLKADANYPGLFEKAYGTKEITSQKMLKALAQFMGTIVSSNSKFDEFKKGTVQFTPVELQGYQLFAAKCATCHTEPLFTDDQYHNIGMPLNNFNKDKGRMRITNSVLDSLKFKTPSLRNVQLTFPYMHDGRFYSLSQVLNHYSTGVVQHVSTDAIVRNRIILNITEINQLIAFLNTLTDNTLTQDIRFKE